MRVFRRLRPKENKESSLRNKDWLNWQLLKSTRPKSKKKKPSALKKWLPTKNKESTSLT